jgi:hypothetical protein
MEHDPRYKRLLQEFFAEFLMLFFPRQAARLDFRHIEWLDKATERGAAAFAAIWPCAIVRHKPEAPAKGSNSRRWRFRLVSYNRPR